MRWRHLPLALLGLVAHVCAQFENTAIVRTIEPAGALTTVTTTYAVKVLEENANQYLVTMSKLEGKRTSFIEARLKGKSENLHIIPKGVQAYVQLVLCAARAHSSIAALLVTPLYYHLA